MSVFNCRSTKIEISGLKSEAEGFHLLDDMPYKLHDCILIFDFIK